MLKLQRLPDWERRLALVVEHHLETPGEWGVADCLLTVADAVEAVTGVDPATRIRGAYSSELGAAKLMRRRKCADVEAVLAKLFPPVGRLMAQRGDVGVVEREGVLAAGFITERGLAVKVEAGLAFYPQTEIKTAFKVG
ncbi:hypothetical protein GGQ99_001281 [Aminobacter niigataensis]|uniref:DUF6950 domain-containing protein n=1 Tax=Aminobacter niigataensis TaxID=83265 RepID=A0ABR6L038_9HYPH|nr:hypothetical protein [Aminobacter niigataensis]MBB4649559.1 hypothetical protein [Aminobacter niigataensis]